MSQPNDKITEIKVAGDENAALAMRYGEYILVWQSMWVFPANSRRIVTECQEVRNQAGVGTLIEQEPHAEARVAPLTTLALARSRSTARCA